LPEDEDEDEDDDDEDDDDDEPDEALPEEPDEALPEDEAAVFESSSEDAAVFLPGTVASNCAGAVEVVDFDLPKIACESASSFIGLAMSSSPVSRFSWFFLWRLPTGCSPASSLPPSSVGAAGMTPSSSPAIPYFGL